MIFFSDVHPTYRCHTTIHWPNVFLIRRSKYLKREEFDALALWCPANKKVFWLSSQFVGVDSGLAKQDTSPGPFLERGGMNCPTTEREAVYSSPSADGQNSVTVL
jgi:hypothetical protein